MKLLGSAKNLISNVSLKDLSEDTKRRIFAWCFGVALVSAFLIWPTTSTDIVAPLIDPPEPDVVHAFAASSGMIPNPELAVTILKVDDETFEALGSPLPMRRSVLAQTLLRIRSEGATAIVLDYEIAAQTTDKDQAELHKALENWNEADPLLLIAGSFVTNADETHRINTPFDHHVGAKDNIRWFNTLYLLDDQGVVRQWNQWEEECDDGTAYFSAQLTLAIHHFGASTEQNLNWRQIEDQLCDGTSEKKLLSLSEPQTIVARTAPISYILHNHASAVPLDVKVGTRDGQQVPAVFQWPLRDYLTDKVSRSAIEDRVVLIGATHRSSRDIHQTPVGQMFGVQVLANSILQAPNVLTSIKLSQTALNALAALIALIGLAMFRFLREFVFAVLFFCVCVIAYVSIAWLITASTAADIIQLAIALLVALIALLSLIDILYDSVIARKGWRSFLND
ncbi:CHASE2 domain-containing protein [Roseibium sp.]|uniref:CHASE2 domain-containing protein n=1 Tax=Roseibium sp. TaxID=1936156 RepID=UPI003D0F9DF7